MALALQFLSSLALPQVALYASSCQRFVESPLLWPQFPRRPARPYQRHFKITLSPGTATGNTDCIPQPDCAVQMSTSAIYHFQVPVADDALLQLGEKDVFGLTPQNFHLRFERNTDGVTLAGASVQSAHRMRMGELGRTKNSLPPVAYAHSHCYVSVRAGRGSGGSCSVSDEEKAVAGT